VRVLENGTVGAIVDTCEQVFFQVYKREGGQWRIADGFWVESPPRDYCTFPAIDHGTPVP